MNILVQLVTKIKAWCNGRFCTQASIQEYIDSLQ